MEQYQEIISLLALGMGTAWASGINLYATLLMLGIMGATGNMTLPPDLQVLASPLVIGAAGLMYMVEFTADKIPGVDSGWDAIHTLIRVPAGAVLAVGVLGDVSSAATVAAAIAGGGMALGTHAAKTGSRVVINTSPEPFSNIFASLSADLAVFAGLWAALNHPTFFLVFLFLFILLLIWALPKLWRAIKKGFSLIQSFFSKKENNTSFKETMNQYSTNISSNSNEKEHNTNTEKDAENENELLLKLNVKKP